MSDKKIKKKAFMDISISLVDAVFKDEGYDKHGILMLSFPLDGDDTELNFSSNMCERHTLETLKSLLKNIEEKLKRSPNEPKK